MILTDGKPTICHRVIDAVLESENPEKRVMDAGLEERRALAAEEALKPIPLGASLSVGPEENERA